MDPIEETSKHIPIVGRAYRTAKSCIKYSIVAAFVWGSYYSWNNFLPPKVKKAICNYIGFTSLEEDIEKKIREKLDLVEEEPKKKVGEKSGASTKTLNEIIA